MVGAVLTQNTAWTNVEKAIERLKAADALVLETIATLEPESLADLIRPSGYYNVKARRLQCFCRFLLESGGADALERLSTDELRARLLAVHGVGPETADDILLYAFERPVFVVDAYTRRIAIRVGLLQGDEHYETIRACFEQALGANVRVYNELHGLIVRHAKLHCRKAPSCDGCPLGDGCRNRNPAKIT